MISTVASGMDTRTESTGSDIEADRENALASVGK